MFFEDQLSCIVATYGTWSNGSISVNNNAFDPKINATRGTVGTATVLDPSKPNNLLVKFPDNPSGANYDVWMTDYENYSVVYSCEQVIPELKIEFVWILTRRVNGLNEQTLTDLKDFVQKRGVPTKKFIKSDYANCKF